MLTVAHQIRIMKNRSGSRAIFVVNGSPLIATNYHVISNKEWNPTNISIEIDFGGFKRCLSNKSRQPMRRAESVKDWRCNPLPCEGCTRRSFEPCAETIRLRLSVDRRRYKFKLWVPSVLVYREGNKGVSEWPMTKLSTGLSMYLSD